MYSPAPTVHRRAHGLAIAAFYFAYFGALGTFGPFVAVYLAARGWSPAAAARLLAVMPLARVLVTPLWTYTADRLRSAAAVVQIAALGALVSFAPGAWVDDRAALAAALLGFTVFRAPMGALTDSLALAWVERAGADYGRLRAWGTVGFLVGALATGSVAAAHPRLVVYFTLGALALCGLCSIALPGASPRLSGALGPALRMLATRPRVMLLLATGLLHQVGLAAYDGLFPLDLTRRAGGRWAGVAVALGAAAEVLMMARGGRWVRSLGTGRALTLVYAVSSVRWLVMAYTTHVAVLVAVQAAHAFTFGVYYMAAVALLDAEAPPEVRASAQGLHQTVVWGVGSAASLALAGRLGRSGDLRGVFLAGSVAAAVAAALASGFGMGGRRAAG